MGVLLQWQFHKFAITLNEFRHVFGIFNNPKPDSGWLRQRVEEEILLHLGGQLGVRPWTILGAWIFEGSEIVEHSKSVFAQ